MIKFIQNGFFLLKIFKLHKIRNSLNERHAYIIEQLHV